MKDTHELVLVIDFGAQYAQLIARRVRECSVYCEIVPYTCPLEKIKEMCPTAIILSGGPASVYVENAPKADAGIFELGVPVLGICYGHQFMCQTLGGKVSGADIREYGKTTVELETTSPLFANLMHNNICWMSHTDFVEVPPAGFTVLALTNDCPVAAVGNPEKKFYGVQFDKKVLCALSGGVDSSVAAVMVHKAIGKQLTCIFVDHGLLRKDEGNQVEKVFKDTFDMNFIRVNAADRFLDKLKGVSDPEQKRKIIGAEFIHVFDEESKKLGKVDFLVQGTIYPDVVESGGTGTSATIKSHHNVGGLPEDMDLQLIEPLRELFKDEVRAVGTELGIPEALVWRQPFPGPGLAIRVLGEVTEEKLKITREADAIFREEIANAKLDRTIWQYFACLPNIHSVGVMGDGRTYSYTVALRAVLSTDGMTSDWAHIPYSVLDTISRRIVNEVQGVNRIVYDITSKPPATIEWE